jgi:signal transduction histidine kinase
MKIVNDLNFRKQAKELGISVWFTPSFLFLVMGIVSVVMMTATYYISMNYESPEIIVIAESVVVSIIFIIGNTIIHGVEQVARLNKMKSEFISIASHQLRTPLSAMKWETELLLSNNTKGLNKRQISSIENLRMMSFRMTKLVSDLLDVAKIDQGKMVFHKEKVDIIKVLESILKEDEYLIKEKNIHIIFNKEKKIPIFWSDSEKIKLILDNLIGNAIKYIASRGKIEIKVKKIRGFLVCSIKDNGAGIPKQQHGQIFNKFFRSDNEVKYQTAGTGLGLYIVKNVVEQAGGKIWFDSKEDVGTIFSFSLPMNT